MRQKKVATGDSPMIRRFKKSRQNQRNESEKREGQHLMPRSLRGRPRGPFGGGGKRDLPNLRGGGEKAD